MNLKDKRAAALKAAQELIQQAKAEGRDLTDDEFSTVEAKNAEIADLDIQIKKADLVYSITSLGTSEDDGEQAQAKSLGDHFVKEASGRFVKGERFAASAPEFKAPVVTTGLQRTDYGSVVPVALRRPVVADLFPSGSVSGNAHTYWVEGTVTDGSGAVAENSLKGEVAGQFTPVTETLTKLAGWTKESDELIEDFPALASVVDNRLLQRLALREEDQLLNGSGTAPNLRGILNRSGIQTETQAAAPDTAAEAIFRAITKVQTATFMDADFIVINPADYQALRLSKDGNGQYFGGGFFYGEYGNGAVDGGYPSLWGKRTIVTSAIAAKTVLVGSSQAAQVFRKGGVRVEMANQNEDDFVNNRVTVLAEERLLLAVYRPAAFVKVTLL